MDSRLQRDGHDGVTSTHTHKHKRSGTRGESARNPQVTHETLASHPEKFLAVQVVPDPLPGSCLGHTSRAEAALRRPHGKSAASLWHQCLGLENLPVFWGNNVNQDTHSQVYWAKYVFFIGVAHRSRFSPPNCISLENPLKSHWTSANKYPLTLWNKQEHLAPLRVSCRLYSACS